MIIIMTIMQNTQIIITETMIIIIFVCARDVSSFLELHRSSRCPLFCGCVGVTAQPALCGGRWRHAPLDGCVPPQSLAGIHPSSPSAGSRGARLQGQEGQGPAAGSRLRASPSLRTQPLVGGELGECND